MTKFKRQPFDHHLKIVMIGDGAVGKTSLLLRFADDHYPTTHMPTIGIDFKIAYMNIKRKVAKLQIWDTAGQERFKNMTSMYFKLAHAVAVVYDCTSQDSFDNVRSWMNQIDNFAAKNIPKILIANKSDLENKVISKIDGELLAEEYGALFIEASAKTGKNVDKAFKKLGEEMIKPKPIPPVEPSSDESMTSFHTESDFFGTLDSKGRKMYRFSLDRKSHKPKPPRRWAICRFISKLFKH